MLGTEGDRWNRLRQATARHVTSHLVEALVIYLWAVPLLILIFLFTLNTFLRGSRKEQTEYELTLLIFLCIGLAFFLSGWTWGLAALASPFILPIMFRIPALLLARRLVDYPDLGTARDAQERMDRMRHEMRNRWDDDVIREREQREAEEAAHQERCVAMAMQLRGIETVLEETDADEDDLGALYDDIKYSHPPALREQVFRNINLIEFYLSATERQADVSGVNRVFHSESLNIKFGLWVHHNPSGASPR